MFGGSGALRALLLSPSRSTQGSGVPDGPICLFVQSKSVTSISDSCSSTACSNSTVKVLQDNYTRSMTYTTVSLPDSFLCVSSAGGGFCDPSDSSTTITLT